jgi:hypothetical protein
MPITGPNKKGVQMNHQVEEAIRAAHKYSDNKYRRFSARYIGGGFWAKALYSDLDILQQEIEFNQNLIARGKRALANKNLNNVAA